MLFLPSKFNYQDWGDRAEQERIGGNVGCTAVLLYCDKKNHQQYKIEHNDGFFTIFSKKNKKLSISTGSLSHELSRELKVWSSISNRWTKIETRFLGKVY